jgi:hypothetical protein
MEETAGDSSDSAAPAPRRAFPSSLSSVGSGGGLGLVWVWPGTANRLPYSDEKVANRTSRVWHGATENGPWTMDKSQTFEACVYM